MLLYTGAFEDMPIILSGAADKNSNFSDTYDAGQAEKGGRFVFRLINYCKPPRFSDLPPSLQ